MIAPKKRLKELAGGASAPAKKNAASKKKAVAKKPASKPKKASKRAGR
jgi:hypothetical protein